MGRKARIAAWRACLLAVLAAGWASVAPAQAAPPRAITDISVTATGSVNPVTAGQSLVYLITVVNNGPDAALGVRVVDTLPLEVTLASSTPSQGTCALEGGVNLTCLLGAMASGVTATVTAVVTVKPSARGQLDNFITVQAADIDPVSGNSATNVYTGIVAAADVRVTLAAPATAMAVGVAGAVTISVSNAGPSDASGVLLSGGLPQGLAFSGGAVAGGTCGGSAASFSCSLLSLASGATATVTLNVAPQPGARELSTATASVSALEPDATPANNAASVVLAVKPQADLAVTLGYTEPLVVRDGAVRYVAQILNNGPSVATGVTLTDTPPAGLAYASAVTTQGSCVAASGAVICAVGTLMPAATATVHLFLTVASLPAAAVTNTASVKSNETDINTANDKDSFTGRITDPSIVPTPTPTPVPTPMPTPTSTPMPTPTPTPPPVHLQAIVPMSSAGVGVDDRSVVRQARAGELRLTSVGQVLSLPVPVPTGRTLQTFADPVSGVTVAQVNGRTVVTAPLLAPGKAPATLRATVTRLAGFGDRAEGLVEWLELDAPVPQTDLTREDPRLGVVGGTVRAELRSVGDGGTVEVRALRTPDAAAAQGVAEALRRAGATLQDTAYVVTVERQRVETLGAVLTLAAGRAWVEAVGAANVRAVHIAEGRDAELLLAVPVRGTGDPALFTVTSPGGLSSFVLVAVQPGAMGATMASPVAEPALAGATPLAVVTGTPPPAVAADVTPAPPSVEEASVTTPAPNGTIALPPTSPPFRADDAASDTPGGGGLLSLKKVAVAGLGMVLLTGLLMVSGVVRVKKK